MASSQQVQTNIGSIHAFQALECATTIFPGGGIEPGSLLSMREGFINGTHA